MITDVTIHADRANGISVRAGEGSIADLVVIRIEEGPSIWMTRTQAIALAELIRAMPVEAGALHGTALKECA